MIRELDPVPLGRLLAVTKAQEEAARSAVQAVLVQEEEIVRRIAELTADSATGSDIHNRSDLWMTWVQKRRGELEAERSLLRARRARLDQHLSAATAKRAALEDVYEMACQAKKKRYEARAYAKILEQALLAKGS